MSGELFNFRGKFLNRKIAGSGHLGWKPRGWQDKNGKHDDYDYDDDDDDDAYANFCGNHHKTTHLGTKWQVGLARRKRLHRHIVGDLLAGL